MPHGFFVTNWKQNAVTGSNVQSFQLEPSFLLLLDEPVYALDVSVQAQILLLLEDMRKELGITYVFISHDLAGVEQLCPIVLVIYSGSIIESGPTNQLFQQRRHPTRTY